MLCIETDFWSFQYCKTLMTIQSSLDLHLAIECSLCQHVMVYVCGQNMVASSAVLCPVSCQLFYSLYHHTYQVLHLYSSYICVPLDMSSQLWISSAYCLSMTSSH